MIPYFILFILSSCFLLISFYFKNNYAYFLVCAILVIFAGFRYDVGLDFRTYCENFDAIHYNGSSSFEFMNWLIAKTVFLIGGTNQLIFLLYAILITYGIFNFIYRVSINREVSIFIFLTVGMFYFSTLNEIRQWAAISMTLFALINHVNNYRFKTILCLVLAILFHLSALIMIIIMPFLKKRYSLHQALLFFGIAVPIAELLKILILLSPYSVYLTFLTGINNFSPALFIFYLLIQAFIIFNCGYFKRSQLLSVEVVLLLNMSLMSFLILLMCYLMGIDFLSTMRANMYFIMQLTILIPLWIRNIQNKVIAVIINCSLLLICTLYFFNIVFRVNYMDHLIPYLLNLQIFD